jgi:CRP/FNR family cyclic AMP-dependent transcriptional regulator
MTIAERVHALATLGSLTYQHCDEAVVGRGGSSEARTLQALSRTRRLSLRAREPATPRGGKTFDRYCGMRSFALMALIRSGAVSSQRLCSSGRRSYCRSMAMARLDDRMKRLLLPLGKMQPFGYGKPLMLAGGPSDKVLLIESGSVNVVLSAPDGVDSIVGRYGPGELIGDIGVIMRQPRSANVFGQEEGEALHVSGARFRELIEHDNHALMLICELMCKRLLRADRRRLASASRKVRRRVVAQPLDWVEDFGERQGTAVVVRGMTQRDLAQTVDASLPTVETELQRLRHEGLLGTGRRRLVLLRHKALEEVLGQPDWRPWWRFSRKSWGSGAGWLAHLR